MNMFYSPEELLIKLLINQVMRSVIQQQPNAHFSFASVSACVTLAKCFSKAHEVS